MTSTTAPTPTSIAGPRFTTGEQSAVAVLVVALIGFGGYGFATHSPSTVGYLVAVSGLAALVLHFRRTSGIRPPYPVALALLVAANLAGGLVNVGHDVLYNAHLWTRVFEYDHPVHASGVFLGIVVMWTYLVPADLVGLHRRHLLVLAVLAGLGLGAINETVEFLTTLAHNGAHVGGYTNTGWDLVSNTVGSLAAAVWISRRPGHAAATDTVRPALADAR